MRQLFYLFIFHFSNPADDVTFFQLAAGVNASMHFAWLAGCITAAPFFTIVSSQQNSNYGPQIKVDKNRVSLQSQVSTMQKHN